MPELASLQKELGGQVAVVGVQEHGTLESGARVLAQSGADYPTMLDTRLGRAFDFRYIPFTVLVRPDGRLGVAIHGAGTKELFREQALSLLSR